MLNKRREGGNRGTRFFTSVISAFGARLVSALIAFLSLPLTYNYLQGERFGILAAIVTIIGSLGFADLGLGFGLQNRWAEYSADLSGLKKRQAISSVFFFLCLVGGLIASVATFLLFFGNLSTAISFKESDQLLKQEATHGIYVLLMATAFTFPFSIVQKIQNAKLEGYKTNLWTTAGSVSSLACLIVATQCNQGIPVIILATHGVNSACIVINFLMEFVYLKKEPFPSVALVQKQMIVSSLKDGLTYLALQISSTLLVTSNSYLLAKHHSFIDVGKSEVGFKLISLFLIPMEASAGYYLVGLNDAVAKQEKTTQRKAVKIYFAATVIFSILVLTGVFCTGNLVLDRWIGNSITLTSSEMLSFAVLAMGTAFVLFASYTMLSPTLITSLLRIYPLASGISILLKCMFVQRYRIEGLNYSQFTGLILVFVVPTIYILKRKAFL